MDANSAARDLHAFGANSMNAPAGRFLIHVGACSRTASAAAVTETTTVDQAGLWSHQTQLQRVPPQVQRHGPRVSMMSHNLTNFTVHQIAAVGR